MQAWTMNHCWLSSHLLLFCVHCPGVLVVVVDDDDDGDDDDDDDDDGEKRIN